MRLKFNKNLSDYELIYLKWEGIQYDRDKLRKFVWTYRITQLLSKVFKSYKEELKRLETVIDHYGRHIMNGKVVNLDEYRKAMSLE